ncbi:hypothetical protein [Paenirhodobacter sp.]|uniref:hypothetical protein n=1 Tax=Paenirhodobacter sp. TaxID=1965326 RepID=UPI003B3E315C
MSKLLDPADGEVIGIVEAQEDPLGRQVQRDLPLHDVGDGFFIGKGGTGKHAAGNRHGKGAAARRGKTKHGLPHIEQAREGP